MEMYVKVFGILLLLLSALFGALFSVSKERKRIEFLRSFAELLGEIYRQIEMLDLPLDEILLRTPEKLTAICKNAVGEKLTLESVALAAADMLDKKETELINGFVSDIGRGYREEQLRICRYYTASLGDILSERERDYPKKRKLAFTLSFCLALGLIILLI